MELRRRPDLRCCVVGATGFEPVTSSVSGHARPFARCVAALHGTTSALLKMVTEPGTAVRRWAACGIAADKLLTAGRGLRKGPLGCRGAGCNDAGTCHGLSGGYDPASRMASTTG